ncbi:MAG: TlpA family protein disulfide reductase [Lachnospiraceae bacterium]
MRRKKKKIYALCLSSLCCFTILNGCASENKTPSTNNTSIEEEQINSQAASGIYKPSEFCISSQDIYEYSYMGLKFSLPKSLLEHMDKKDVAMINLEEANEDKTALKYALINWKTMTEEQCDMEVKSGGNSFYDWADSLTSIGAIGAYQSEVVEKLDMLTGCTEHKEIGKSEDGLYTYYLSVNSKTESNLQEEINNISYEIIDMISLQEALGFDEPEGAIENVGEFSMQDIEGETYTQDMFADYDLTMVNVFTTWCTPCVNEIPDLQKLREDIADKKVNVVGIVLDVIDGTGKADEEVIEKAKLLAERTGATYPFLIPDSGYLNGRLSGINAVPETFFVDKEGNIVGETYSGSRSFEEWKEIVEVEWKGVAK